MLQAPQDVLKNRLVKISPDRTLAFIEPADLGAVAADFHIAPAAAVVAAGVQEEPPAGFGLARPHTVQVGRGQQVNGRTNDGPENAIANGFAFVLLVPLPFETVRSPAQTKVARDAPPFAADFIEIRGRRIVLLQDCGKNTVEYFPESTSTVQNFGGWRTLDAVRKPAE